jgi:hypothetical protein
MPKLSVTHEAPLELIKQHPALAVDLLRAMTGMPLRAGLDVRLASTSLNTITPVQYAADSVVVVSDPATGEPLVAIIGEPQGRDDKTKKFSWPVYLTNVRRETGCDSAYLIVVCPVPAEAERCRAVIPLGHPGFELRPIVIDPEHAPDGEDGGPYMLVFLASLLALDLENPNVAGRVLGAIVNTGASYADRKVLTAIILDRASEAAQRLLRDMMDTMEWRSDFIEGYEKHGVEQGSLATKRQDVLRILDVRGLRITTEQRALVEASADLAQLDRWFERSLTAATADDVFSD